MRNSKKGEPQNERYIDNESKRSGEIENHFSGGRKQINSYRSRASVNQSATNLPDIKKIKSEGSKGIINKLRGRKSLRN